MVVICELGGCFGCYMLFYFIGRGIKGEVWLVDDNFLGR